MKETKEVFRIKQVCDRKQLSLDELASKIWNERLKKVGITYHSLYARISGNMSFSKLKEIADALETEPAELIETGEGYSHFYDDKTGEWLGIRKK
ncbi:helix-turn-helix transcriptional regulator [Chryseobacterium soli]|uniref:helix-turn-helix domain-containing protein n=1 Tax=Chryseobacterium soli TaxID=445961 RepID=UPI002955CAEA|nr:helix-turn-helix transcriptional regulator [Chryseobacterium soli]MDV7696278.1 helix-turn-helix transcriptional regulator [Chryseobacterium soli]